MVRIMKKLLLATGLWLGLVTGAQAAPVGPVQLSMIPNCTAGALQFTLATGVFTCGSSTGLGNVTGPGSSTAGHIATFADSSGKVLQDTSTVVVTVNPEQFDAGSGGALPGSLPTGTGMLLAGADAAGSTRIVTTTFGGVGRYTVQRADGTRASPTSLLTGEAIGSIESFGYDGSGAYGGQSASLTLTTNEAWSSALHHGTDLAFRSTAPAGSEVLGMTLRGPDLLIGTTTDDGTDLLQVAGSLAYKGQATLNGTSSGVITLKAQAAAGTFEWDWPTTAGTAGQVLTSQAGAGTAMTWTTPVSLGTAQTFTAAQRGQPATLSISTATFTPNFDTAQNFSITLIHASCPCTIANPSTTPVAGQSGMIAVAQSSTGSDTTSWGSQYKFAGATAPTLSTGANNVDFFPYYVFSATQIIVGAGVLNAH
jgi:hypothetical protein